MSVAGLIDRLRINYKSILFGDEVTSSPTNTNELSHYNRPSELNRPSKPTKLTKSNAVNNIIEIPIDRSNGKRIIIYTSLLAKKNSSSTETSNNSKPNKLKDHEDDKDHEDNKLTSNDESDKSINVFMFIKCLLYLRNYLDKAGYKCSLEEMEQVTAIVAGKIWRHVDDERFEDQMKLVGFGLSKVLGV